MPSTVSCCLMPVVDACIYMLLLLYSVLVELLWQQQYVLYVRGHVQCSTPCMLQQCILQNF